MIVKETKAEITVEHPKYLFMYNLDQGCARMKWNNETMCTNFFGSVTLKDGTVLKSIAYSHSSLMESEDIDDDFGKGLKISILHKSDQQPDLIQTYYFYEEQSYFIAKISVKSDENIETNHMVPFQTDQFDVSALVTENSDVRLLFVPFDNDKWIRYKSQPVSSAVESSEVTSIFDNEKRKGFVIGSISHDLWKTGIKVDQYNKETKKLHVYVYGGAANEVTRDTIEHGYVKGERITSPKVFVGFFTDYRSGLETYGSANAKVQPPLPWEEGVPFGWNSWSAVADQLDYEDFKNTSDFFKESLQHNHFENKGEVYINFDSFWDNLSEKQVKDAVHYAKRNGQKAGIYFTPFAYWFDDFDRKVEGTEGSYTYRELLLKDHKGNILPSLDGGYALDPTHPGTIERLKWQFQRFVDWGYDYVKLDFMAHGALEGDHYRKDIYTGKQAYNYGMKKIISILDPERIGRPFFINLSISPIFPYAYAHSRRVSCDVFGSIGSTEYLLNSVTYGWWINDTIYRFNDPDHTVLYKSFNEEPITQNEALSRFNASVISGTVLLGGDDYRREEARERAKKFFTNEKVNAIARKGKSFRPIEGNTGDSAADTFYLHDPERDTLYIAVFNFDRDKTVTKEIDLERLGLDKEVFEMEDLWSEKSMKVSHQIKIELKPSASTILKLKKTCSLKKIAGVYSLCTLLCVQHKHNLQGENSEFQRQK